MRKKVEGVKELRRHCQLVPVCDQNKIEQPSFSPPCRFDCNANAYVSKNFIHLSRERGQLWRPRSSKKSFKKRGN